VKLIVPSFNERTPTDVRMVQLAEHFGLECEWLPLVSGIRDPAEFIDASVKDKNASFAINPSVIGKWLSTEIFPAALAAYLISRFPFLLVHSIDPGSMADSAVREFSEDCLQGVVSPDHPERGYRIVPETEDICARFAGLSFGPANPVKDRVFKWEESHGHIRPLILIGDQPFFVQIKRRTSEIFFLAATEIADLEANVSEVPLVSYFSQLLPPAMFLRYTFKDEYWQPSPPRATLIIDDPPLWKNYGFLNYERLIALLDQTNFHVSIAFIPYYYRRSTPSVVNLFKERSDRLSICFHGNNHTAAELGGDDTSTLNETLMIARARMETHFKKEGIACDNVVVFPQGVFSTKTMLVLKAQNFLAAVNSGHSPGNECVDLPLSELLQPAILKYNDFPLFLRKYVRAVKPEDVAFNVFFGRPVLLVEHHEVFKDVERLLETVKMINRLVPDIRWTNLQTVVENAYLARCCRDGTRQVRAYANVVRIENASDEPQKCSVEWFHSRVADVKNLLRGGTPIPRFGLESGGVGLTLELPPNSLQRLTVVNRNDFPVFQARQTFRGRRKAFYRRSLSEFRDKYLSRHPSLLSLAKALLPRGTKS
jgi:hypothetical protein